MKIQLTLADEKLTGRSGMTKSGGMGKRNPLNVPVMDATARAVSAAGRVATDIAEKMYVAEGQRETLEAYNAANDGFNNAIADLKKPENQGLSVKEHNEWYKEKADGLKNSVLASMKNFKAKQAFSQKFDVMASDNGVKAQEIGWNREIDKGRTTLYNSLDKYTNQVAAGNFRAIGDAEAAVKGSVKSGYITEEQGVKVLDEFNNAATVSFWKAQSDNLPTDTFDSVYVPSKTKAGFPVSGKKGLYKQVEKLPESFNNMDEEQKRQTLLYIRTNFEEFNRKTKDIAKTSKVLLHDDMRANLARIQDTGAGDPTIGRRIMEGYADNPEAAAQTFEVNKRNEAQAASTYLLTSEMKKANPEQEAAIIDSLDARDKRQNQYTEGLTDDRRLEVIRDVQSAAYAKKQALAKDPVSYIASTFKDELSYTRPEARNTFLIMKQRELGVPAHAVNLLPTRMAEDIVKNLELLKGQDKIKALQSLQSKYTPEEYGIVYRQLVDQKLPLGTMFLISQDKPNQTFVRETYGQVLNMKEGELADALGERAKEVRADFNEAFTSGFEDYAGTVEKTDYNTIRLNGVRDIIKKAVMLDAQDSSVDIKDRTQYYLDKSFNDVYGFQNGYRYPKNLSGDNLDTFLTHTKANVEIYDIMVPSTYGPVADKFVRQEYISNLKSKGRWVTNGSGDGAMLKDSNNEPVLIKRADGTLGLMDIKFKVADQVGGSMEALKSAKLVSQNPDAISTVDFVWTEGLKKSAGVVSDKVSGVVKSAVKEHIKAEPIYEKYKGYSRSVAQTPGPYPKK